MADAERAKEVEMALIECLEGGGSRGVICDPPNVMRALRGRAGTRVIPD